MTQAHAEPVYLPRLIFWEVTKGCNLRCIHCRATPTELSSPDDLSTTECKGLLDQFASFANPIVVLTGGEPLFRKDIFDLGAYGTAKGLRMALATNGTMITPEIADRVVAAGFQRVSVSLDGADAATHDGFRRIPGSFDAATHGLRLLRERGMSTQINTSITIHNAHQMEEILALALDLGADALHIFLLVPVGCGVEIGEDMMVSAQEYERILNWLYERSKTVMIDLKATCAPHYFRIRAQRIIEDKKRGVEPQPFVPLGTQLKAGHVDQVTRPKNGDGAGNGKDHGLSAMTKGCLAGTGICFISNRGKVYPCGYLPAEAGDVRAQGFQEVWERSLVFQNLRDPDLLRGKCGGCEFKFICEGCRARAYAQTGNYLDEEPYCAYVPDGRKTAMEVHEAHISAEAEMPVTVLTWTEEAKARLKRVPFFVRKMVIGKTEAFAQERGIAVITPEVLDRAKGMRHGVK